MHLTPPPSPSDSLLERKPRKASAISMDWLQKNYWLPLPSFQQLDIFENDTPISYQNDKLTCHHSLITTPLVGPIPNLAETRLYKPCKKLIRGEHISHLFSREY